MNIVEETFRQLLQKVWYLWRLEIFVYIICIRPKFVSPLLTDKIRKGVIERDSLKIFVSGAYPVTQRLCVT